VFVAGQSPASPGGFHVLTRKQQQKHQQQQQQQLLLQQQLLQQLQQQQQQHLQTENSTVVPRKLYSNNFKHAQYNPTSPSPPSPDPPAAFFSPKGTLKKMKRDQELG
jgi:type II secretory pathway pseudopilin PulG